MKSAVIFFIINYQAHSNQILFIGLHPRPKKKKKQMKRQRLCTLLYVISALFRKLNVVDIYYLCKLLQGHLFKEIVMSFLNELEL